MKRTSMVAAAIGAVAVLGIGGTALAGTALAGTALVGTALAGSSPAGSSPAGTASAGSSSAGTAPAGSSPPGTKGLASDDHGADAVVTPRATGDDFGLRGDGTVDDDPVGVSPTSRVGFGEATSPAPAVSADRHGGRSAGDDDDNGRHGGDQAGEDGGRR